MQMLALFNIQALVVIICILINLGKQWLESSLNQLMTWQ